ncbi:MAG: hypothetical protein J0G30_12265 [Actinomycetales bacterium]|nr:hypothetical protein [Actinomycetales bacterium]
MDSSRSSRSPCRSSGTSSPRPSRRSTRRTPTLPQPPRRPRLRAGRRRAELEAPKTGEVVLPGDPDGPRPPSGPSGEGSDGEPGEPLEPGTRRSRRALGAGSALLLAVVLLGGCTSVGAPEPASASDPAVDAAVADLPAVAVTVPQFRHILTEAVATIDEADQKRDASLAAERLAGPALAERTAFYTAVSRDSSIEAPHPIPDDNVRIMVPEQRDSWPRTVFAVVQSNDATDPYFGLVLIQDTPRDNYLVHYAVQLEPEADIPGLAPPSIGSPRVAADNKLGVVAPEELADDYGDLLINGEDSPAYDLFDPENDTLRTAIGQQAKNDQRAKLPSTASLVFSHQQGDGEVVSFGTVDGGQLVATQLYDIETIRPAEQGAAINPSGAVAALSGKTQTTSGIVATYGVQLLFYLPPGADEKAQVQLLGFSQGLISATE